MTRHLVKHGWNEGRIHALTPSNLRLRTTGSVEWTQQEVQPALDSSITSAFWS